jgi:eukaryotic-like serine/threonine-protein kinase
MLAMFEGAQVGAYRILHRIGEGGMGSVWLAEHVTLGRRAALKVLHAELSANPEIVARFFNEARAATAIADPGIVQIFDFGQHVDGSAYIVMELLDGEPLAHRLQRCGALAVPDALRIMRQVASTLGAAHARGIVHRDLKPDNIFLVRDPEVSGGERAKILDFGIAKLTGDQVGVKTQTSAVMGTPTYMSPEQCRGAGQVDQRSDVYALGCVLFELVTATPPFVAEGVGDIIAMHLREAPPAPSQRVPGVGLDVDQLVLRCLAKDPAQRFASAAELAIAIGALVGSSPQVPPVRVGVPTAIASTPTTLSAATGARVIAGATRSRAPVWLGIGVVAAAGIAIAVVVSRGGAGESPVPNAAPPAAASAAPAPPSLPPPLPDPRAQVTPVMKDVLARFVDWSKQHAGQPCPDMGALGGASDDPWGRPLRLTCTDQPGDQIVGAISDGSDRTPGTAEDIASWQLGADVTDLVRGERWKAVVKPASVTPSKPVANAGAAKPAPPKAAKPTPKKATPTLELDAYGMPISR